MHNDMKHSDRNEYSQQVYAYLANIRNVMKYVAYLHRVVPADHPGRRVNRWQIHIGTHYGRIINEYYNATINF